MVARQSRFAAEKEHAWLRNRAPPAIWFVEAAQTLAPTSAARYA